jgi:hypothetical protein
LQYWGIGIDASGGSTREALAMYRAAVKLQPDLWTVHADIQNDLIVLGDEEGAWRAGEDLRKAAVGHPGRAHETDFVNWDYLTWNLPALLAGTVADAEATAGAGTASSSAGLQIADIQVRLHDPDAAELALKTTKEDPHDPNIAAITHFEHGRLAAEAGDEATAVTEMEAFGMAYANPAVSTNNPGSNCWIAPAEEAAGHRDKADAVLNTAGTFVDCYRFRGDILDGRGNWRRHDESHPSTVDAGLHDPRDSNGRPR